MYSKILILANSSGGLYNFRRELIAQLAQMGSISVSVPDYGRACELEELGCSIVSIPLDRRSINPINDAKLFLRYWKLLRKEKPDLVITYTIKPNIYGGIACRMLKISYAVNITGLGTAFQKRGALRNVVTLLYRTALKKANVVFFENAENQQILLVQNVVKKEQACLLSGAGVNTEHFPYTPYPTASSATRFLFVGRIMREKGVDELFAAMRRLHREGVPCSLDMLGGYEEDYSEVIQEYVQEGWLHYHGFQKDVRPFIEQAHCFVLPSWHEGMANTNLESASMGRPLITSNIHGCKEAVIDGVSGFLCEPRNADCLYEALVRFMELSWQERAAMGQAGRAHMETVFDKKKVVAQTVAALKR